MKIRTAAAAALVLLASARALHAQGVATDRLIESITVTGVRTREPAPTPGTFASRTADDLREQNLVNPEDALRYAPNLTIRKRYIGDRNALIGGRSFSTLQAARALVLMDGYLLSNFLGRFDAPRWNMITPEEIERVDVLYGPFSALYPGASIGATVLVTTRRPEAFELAVRTTAHGQRYDEYGLRDDYGGYQASAYIADRVGRGWWSFTVNRQDATSHPMQYHAVSANSDGEFPVVQGEEATRVTGVVFDRDPQGRRRAVFGAGAGAIDRSQQNQFKARAGYELADVVELEAFAALWRNESQATNRTFMRDENGAPVWSGRVLAGDVLFDVPPTAFAPSLRDEEHLQWGAALRTTRPSGWNGSIVYSRYAIREDALREALAPDPLAAQGAPGVTTKRDGTGWRTFETQAVYASEEEGAHTLALGYHENAYRLRNPVYETAEWRGPDGGLRQDVRGETLLRGWYVQGARRIADAWSVTLGLRYERWRAFGGAQRAGEASVQYEDRDDSALSPKASVAFTPDADWTLRLSVGRGVRFPTVAELFQGTTSANSIVVNDPNLEAETSDSVDFTIERAFSWGEARASLFEDDVRDSIFAQTNITVTPNVTNVQNVDRVVSRGIELAFSASPRALPAIELTGNLAYVRTRIRANRNNPAYVGSEWPRVPRWRGNLQATWRPSGAWLASVALRHSGRMYGRLENDDPYSDVYGGVSSFTMVDARVAYTSRAGVEVALGVDNLTDRRAYQYHPYPGRTAYAEARWSFGGRR